MGRRIAFSCILGRRQTLLWDAAPGVAADAFAVVHSMVADRVRDGRLPQEAESSIRLLTVVPSLRQCVEDVDLVIESVSESVELKRQVFSEIDKHAPPRTLLATNSSSIPGSWLASATRRPESIFNANFGTPDHRKVEVMGNPKTSQETLQSAVGFLRDIGLVPILVRGEIVGYATNRIWRAIKKEVLFLLDRGYLNAEEIDCAWMLDWGTPIGPCGLMDKVGLDVVRDIEMIYYSASEDPSDKPPELLHKMIQEGKLGVKSGIGFYKYPDPAYSKEGFLNGRNSMNKKT
jgi:3-hydroxybutyryl-CoA dehydrogenase